MSLMLVAGGLAAGGEVRREPPSSRAVAEVRQPAPVQVQEREAPATSSPEVPEVVVSRPVAVSVPALDLEAPLIGLGLDEEGRLEVPEDFDVAGWFTDGPAPGAPGPAVIAGHVDSFRGPAVFWRLGELEPGDQVVVHGEDGRSREFVVDGVGRWPKDEFPTNAVYREADGAELRLITCGGEFDEQARSYRDNVVVFARAV